MEAMRRWTEDLGSAEHWGLRVASGVFFFAMVVTSCIAPIGSNSQTIPMPINPAGYAFAIWFVIWLFQVRTLAPAVLSPAAQPLIALNSWRVCAC
jgi:hypothetical protein